MLFTGVSDNVFNPAGRLGRLVKTLPKDNDYQRIINTCWTQADILLQYVVCGDQAAAEEILKKNPRLLLETGTAYDFSRHTKTGTAFQVALRMQDVEMWQMMEKYFKLLPDGDAEKAIQFYAEFPDDKPLEQRPFDISDLVNAITISSDTDIQAQLKCEQNDSMLCQAFNKFRYDFAQHSLNEKHFNPQHLINALTVYDAQFDGWSENQRNLFCRQVFGYMQRYMPACYAQAFAQGIYYITEEREALRRTFDYRVGGGAFLPLDSDPALRLGYEIFAGWRGGLDYAVVPIWGSAVVIKKLCQAKTAALGELKQRVQNPENGLEPSQCVIS